MCNSRNKNVTAGGVAHSCSLCVLGIAYYVQAGLLDEVKYKCPKCKGVMDAPFELKGFSELVRQLKRSDI